MALLNIFSETGKNQIVARVNQLNTSSAALWGTMTVDQMLAHCNVTYEMEIDGSHDKPNFLIGFILKTFVKKSLVNEAPIKKNGSTAPQFVIKGNKDFELEKTRLINYLNKTVQLGESYFDGKTSNSFGKLNKTEWNNLFYKHLNHHLSQFGV